MMSVADEYDVFRCVSLCEMSLKGWYWKIFQIPLRLRTKKTGGVWSKIQFFMLE